MKQYLRESNVSQAVSCNMCQVKAGRLIQEESRFLQKTKTDAKGRPCHISSGLPPASLFLSPQAQPPDVSQHFFLRKSSKIHQPYPSICPICEVPLRFSPCESQRFPLLLYQLQFQPYQRRTF